MRLVCPNCSAQYEIDIALVPEDGRDVQCSNCGHTWFEMPPAAASKEDEPLATVAIEDTLDDVDDNVDAEETSVNETNSDLDQDDAEPSHAAKAIAAASETVTSDDPFEGKEDPFESVGDDNASEELAAAAVSAGAGVVKARRPADAADLDVLREEAERELSQRRAPPSESLEAQTELGLDTIQQRGTPSRALRARMARSDGNIGADSNKTRMIDFEEGTDEDYKAPQRDLLPDIDEINSTLKPGTNRNDPAVQAVRRKGFRLGFGMMMLAAIALIAAYAFAPMIAEAVPAAEPTLITYVDMANQVRDWIDELISGFA